jgi:hypothetical protein
MQDSSATLPIPSPERGLLEQSSLLFPHGSRNDLRILTDTGQPAGVARWRYRGWWMRPSWWQLEVYEEDQSPLLCTIWRPLALFPRYEVRDAEEELVGLLAGRYVLDRWHRCLMTFRPNSEGGLYLGENNALVASWTTSPSEARLKWCEMVHHDPFAKMLLLAAVLVK